MQVLREQDGKPFGNLVNVFARVFPLACQDARKSGTPQRVQYAGVAYLIDDDVRALAAIERFERDEAAQAAADDL